MITIKNAKSGFYGLIIASTIAMAASQAWAADDGLISKQAADNGVISTTEANEESYCHLKFPAIEPSTLGTDHPQLEDPNTGDIIDYYGPCDHDPLGKAEVESQEQDQLVRGLRNWTE
jgi:hypothetical protein